MRKNYATFKGRQGSRSWHIGKFAESLVILWMWLRFYNIIDYRYKTKLGELDLVVKRGKTLIIVEIKLRPSLAESLESVPKFSQERIVRATQWYLAKHPKYNDYTVRFDIVAIAPWRFPIHIKNAFYA